MSHHLEELECDPRLWRRGDLGGERLGECLATPCEPVDVAPSTMRGATATLAMLSRRGEVSLLDERVHGGADDVALADLLPGDVVAVELAVGASYLEDEDAGASPFLTTPRPVQLLRLSDSQGWEVSSPAARSWFIHWSPPS